MLIEGAMIRTANLGDDAEHRGLRGSPRGKHNGREYAFLYLRSTNIGANQPNRGRD